MNIKKYIADSAPEAIRMVKKEMGADAVILETRTIRPSGNGPTGTAERIEVTAAVDYDAPTGKNQRSVSLYHPELLKRWEILESEIKEVKGLLESIEAGSLLKPELYFNRTLRKRYSWFKHFGLTSHVISDLMKEMGPMEGSVEASEQEQLAECLNRVVEKVAFDGTRAAGNGRRICAFIGPTGVGKTTTLAKLAALNVIRHGKRVGLITVDTFRIAAVTQLETYARILSLPLEVAETGPELQAAIRKHGNCDTIFIDTAGRSPNNHKDLTDMEAVFKVDEQIHHYLVLSATTQYSSLLHAERGFGILPVNSYIFTKLDEADNASALVNFLVSQPKPISFFTTGQQVPEDIEPASKKKLASMILNRKGSAVVSFAAEVN